MFGFNGISIALFLSYCGADKHNAYHLYSNIMKNNTKFQPNPKKQLIDHNRQVLVWLVKVHAK